MAPFGVLFVGNSYPITSDYFAQVDPTHWVLDVCSLVKPQYWELKEVCLFLTAPDTLDPSLALGLYLKSGSGDWVYMGCCHSTHPSEVMPLRWPAQEGGYAVPPGPGFIQVGVSIEPLAEVAAKESSRVGDKLAYAKRVGMDLYHFLASFATQTNGDTIVIPTKALDRWYERFERKFRLDPDFLTRNQDKI
ncbi:hypothetical protein OEZ85_011856 [Tetradesmus obliquus]|uniref:Uncharacterized protein n=2 Tax=Tetradesmus obliquus TaxID=3088 RepID=A0A383VG88_TETOB|nr:hypothetical protein OEZ85_011856 [Tetradesmus obliquus]|eukprot:jgi/Sobl393_1/834/SZX64575.1